jgi:hypothetical protein
MLAYVHPISGSVILQVASAGILAAAFTFKSWWGKAKELGRRGWQRSGAGEHFDLLGQGLPARSGHHLSAGLAELPDETYWLTV